MPQTRLHKLALLVYCRVLLVLLVLLVLPLRPAPFLANVPLVCEAVARLIVLTEYAFVWTQRCRRLRLEVSSTHRRHVSTA